MTAVAEPKFKTAKVVLGRRDGMALTAFPEGVWLAGSNGWPLVLDHNAQPQQAHQPPIGDERYVQKVLAHRDRGQTVYELLYVWEPSLAAWLYVTQGAS